ncbi:hypothetical protein DP116_21540 [Brasilonema bromeliae SPC951]|uniref:Uncharacterized protein n=1 Tax=Brasilonema bromeliae SPC951 TaxID=385972 RepID=A0ABX1PD68_9CYAN|nr:hypothetical protein [Brasilonema bromeliae SPC951]
MPTARLCKSGNAGRTPHASTEDSDAPQWLLFWENAAMLYAWVPQDPYGYALCARLRAYALCARPEG